MDENSISIINRTNGQVIGEKAQALPIEIKTSFSWLKIFILGLLFGWFLVFILVVVIKRQVTVVEVAGKADTYVEYEIQ
jgi:hypothetical protein